MTDHMAVGGRRLVVRAIEPDDADRLARLFARLSPQSVLYRFFAPVPAPTRPELLRLAAVDHCRREALVALDGDEIVAVARYDTHEDRRHAEIALTVEDAWQHRGIGRRLSTRLATLAAERGFTAFRATILWTNRAALALVHDIAPDALVECSHGECEATIPLARVS